MFLHLLLLYFLSYFSYFIFQYCVNVFLFYNIFVNFLGNLHKFTFYLFVISIRFVIPIPTNLHQGAIKRLSSSDIWKSLSKGSIYICLTTLCKGNMKFSMFSIVLMKNVNLCLSPDVNAKHTTYR